MVWVFSGYIIYFIRRKGKKKDLKLLSDDEKKLYNKENLKDMLISAALGFAVAFFITIFLAAG